MPVRPTYSQQLELWAKRLGFLMCCCYYLLLGGMELLKVHATYLTKVQVASAFWIALGLLLGCWGLQCALRAKSVLGVVLATVIAGIWFVLTFCLKDSSSVTLTWWFEHASDLADSIGIEMPWALTRTMNPGRATGFDLSWWLAMCLLGVVIAVFRMHWATVVVTGGVIAAVSWFLTKDVAAMAWWAIGPFAVMAILVKLLGASHPAHRHTTEASTQAIERAPTHAQPVQEEHAPGPRLDAVNAKAGVLAGCSILLTIWLGELLLRPGEGATFTLALGLMAIGVLGIYLSLRNGPSERPRLFWKGLAYAEILGLSWYAIRLGDISDNGLAVTATFSASVAYLLVRLLQMPWSCYGGLGAVVGGLLFFVTQDPELTIVLILLVFGLPVILLLLKSAIRFVPSRFKPTIPVALTQWPRRLTLTRSPRLNPDNARAGFLASCIVMATIILGEMLLTWGETDVVKRHLGLVGVGALLASLAVLRSKAVTQPLLWKGLWPTGIIGLTWAGQTLYTGAPVGPQAATSYGICLLFVMVAVFRTSPLYYAAAVGVLTIAVGVIAESWWVALAMLLGISGLLVVLNYAVQLVLDHEREIRSLWFKKAPDFEIAGASAVLLMIPIFMLVAVGGFANAALQKSLIHSMYTDNPFYVMDRRIVNSGCDLGPKGAAELELDLECTIKADMAMFERLADEQVATNLATIQRASNDTPAAAVEAMRKIKPATIDHRPACIRFEDKFAGIKVTFRTGCRELVHYINEVLERNHQRMVTLISSRLEAGNASVNEVINNNAQQYREEMSNQIRILEERLRTTNRQVFKAVRVLQYLTWFLLIVTLIATFQMLMGRIFFDKDTRRRLTFRLAKPHQRVQDITSKSSDNILLREDIPTREGRPTRWFVSLQMARRGAETRMNAVIPLKRTAVVQRILSSNYVMTAIDVMPLNLTQNNAQEANEPVISVPGDHRLVRIILKPGQSIGFRMADLVAFTDDIELKTRYTTHIGANLLNLGSFCTVAVGGFPKPGASGENMWTESTQQPPWGGAIILRSEGIGVTTCSDGTSTPVSNLLAWDDSQEFVLEQVLHPWRVWFNEPSVVAVNSKDSVLLDEGTPGRWPILSRLGNMFRYFWLPF